MFFCISIAVVDSVIKKGCGGIPLITFFNASPKPRPGFPTSYVVVGQLRSGADPGFQVKGGALKRICAQRREARNLFGISCEKSRFYAKKSYFFPILGRAPPSSAPEDDS